MYSEYASFASSRIVRAFRARSEILALFRPSFAIVICCSSIRQSNMLRCRKSSGIFPSSLSAYAASIRVRSPLSADQIRGYLNSMRLCLVEPRWEEVNVCNTSEQSWTGVGVKRTCVTMAEDGGYVLVFDPVDEQYHLAWRGEGGLGTWGIRGDGVGNVSLPDSCGSITGKPQGNRKLTQSRVFGKFG
jgi:hypothetical protein